MNHSNLISQTSIFPANYLQAPMAPQMLYSAQAQAAQTPQMKAADLQSLLAKKGAQNLGFQATAASSQA